MAEEPTGETAAGKRPLGPRYRTLFAASTISNLGDGIGLVAYPWLASAVTRDPLLVSLIIVVQRLPWLVFSLPAGVIADRFERRRIMVAANTARAVLTGIVAVSVLAIGDRLPGPDELEGLEDTLDTNVTGYVVVLVATLLLGIAEVLYDNTAQTIMPSLVDEDQLEKANGRLWSTEQVMNTLAGPALGAALLVVSFALPFGVDALTFALSRKLRERNGLGQILVETQGTCNRPGDLRNLQRVGQSGTVVVALMLDEYLGLVFQPAERAGVNDPVPVPLETRPERAFFFRHQPATAAARIRGISRPHLSVLSLSPVPAVSILQPGSHGNSRSLENAASPESYRPRLCPALGNRRRRTGTGPARGC